MGVPLVLVVDAKKDSMDEVISGVSYIRSNGVKLEGVIVNSFDAESQNIGEKYFPQLVKEYTAANVWGCFPYIENYEIVGADTLIAETLSHFNIEEVFGLEIAKLKV